MNKELKEVVKQLTSYGTEFKLKSVREWYKRGVNYGDSGLLYLGTKDYIDNYVFFGTIENPCKDMQFLSMMKNPLYDFDAYSNASIDDSFRFEIWDLSKLNKDEV